MAKKFICTVCGYIHEGDAAPEKCPLCKVPASKFKEMEETAVMREGVKYYPMMLSVGDMDNPEDDRLFYYDANLPRPDWQIGDMLTVTAHDKALGAWVKA